MPIISIALSIFQALCCLPDSIFPHTILTLPSDALHIDTVRC